MMHELKKMVHDYQIAATTGLKTVMATVVALDGSSYRRPGVRMLIREDGKMTGAVSGGCVEKEIARRAQPVFKDNKARMMTYDGRYRLGCEGVLYILIEPFAPTQEFVDVFELLLERRESLAIRVFFSRQDHAGEPMGSVAFFPKGERISFSGESPTMFDSAANLHIFEQTLKPCFHLVIFGVEHDAVQLSAAASLLGWQVTVVAPIDDPRTLENFPGANKIEHIQAAQVNTLPIESQTAVILMTHNYASDLKFLIALRDTSPAYVGLLGPARRRERLLSEYLEVTGEFDERIIHTVHGPAGLNLGAETPQEIAVSIIAEILSVVRKQHPMPLKNKDEGIHRRVTEAF